MVKLIVKRDKKYQDHIEVKRTGSSLSTALTYFPNNNYADITLLHQKTVICHAISADWIEVAVPKGCKVVIKNI